MANPENLRSPESGGLNRKETIKQLFPNVGGKTAILPNGNGIAVFYDYSLNVPIDDPELKRIQINVLVKEWSVN